MLHNNDFKVIRNGFYDLATVWSPYVLVLTELNFISNSLNFQNIYKCYKHILIKK